MRQETKVLSAGFIFIFVVCAILFYGLHQEHSVWQAVDGRNYSVEDIFASTLSHEERFRDEADAVVLDGYIYQKGESIKRSAAWLVLYDTCEGKYYKIPTLTKLREDITKEQQDGCSYDGGGYQTKINKSRLQSGVEYRLFLLYQNNGEDRLLDLKKSIYR